MSDTRPTSHARLAALAVAVLLAAVVALVSVVSPATAGAPCAVDGGWGTNRADLAAQVVQLANAYRAERGLTELSVSSALTDSASWKSLHMAGNGYFAHDDPDPVSRGAYQRAKDCGFEGTTWGENIAYGYPTARAVMAGWIASPGHRANLENPAFTTIGVGVGQAGRGTLYWTQNFGNDEGTVQPRSAESRTPASPQARQTVRAGRARSGTVLLAAIDPVDRTTGRHFSPFDVACRAEIGGTRLDVVIHAVRQGRATCGWVVPADGAGKTLAASITARGRGTVAVGTLSRSVD
jgi:uncharacterized protein YkwD